MNPYEDTYPVITITDDFMNEALAEVQHRIDNKLSIDKQESLIHILGLNAYKQYCNENNWDDKCIYFKDNKIEVEIRASHLNLNYVPQLYVPTQAVKTMKTISILVVINTGTTKEFKVGNKIHIFGFSTKKRVEVAKTQRFGKLINRCIPINQLHNMELLEDKHISLR